MSRSSEKPSLPWMVRLRRAGGLTSRTTCMSRAMVTASPSAGTLPSGHAAGSDQRSVRTSEERESAGASAWSWAWPSWAAAPGPNIRAAGKIKETRYRPGCKRMSFIPSHGTLCPAFVGCNVAANEAIAQAAVALVLFRTLAISARSCSFPRCKRPYARRHDHSPDFLPSRSHPSSARPGAVETRRFEEAHDERELILRELRVLGHEVRALRKAAERNS